MPTQCWCESHFDASAGTIVLQVMKCQLVSWQTAIAIVMQRIELLSNYS